MEPVVEGGVGFDDEGVEGEVVGAQCQSFFQFFFPTFRRLFFISFSIFILKLVQVEEE